MSIGLEFIDFIVPIKKIKEKYPGGWGQCLKDHDYSIGRCVWYDKHLFRTGAMNPMDIENLVSIGKSLDLTLMRKIKMEIQQSGLMYVSMRSFLEEKHYHVIGLLLMIKVLVFF